MDYRIEKTHDEQLIEIVERLNEVGKLPIFSRYFSLPELGSLSNAQRRRPFDVELSFENLSVIVETKVDSAEGYRDDTWQTSQIVEDSQELNYLNESLNERKQYFYITYGTSEFYTKQRENGDGLHMNGPYSDQFEHITLNRMIEFVQLADSQLPQCDTRYEWLKLMRFEKKRRGLAAELLKEFSNFRKKYLEIQDFEENDFPRNRFLFCSPELAFPVMFNVLNKWNRCEKHRQKFGQLKLVPVGRPSPSIHDSILNLCGLEFMNTEQTSKIYLEVNEDFNLNVKISWTDKFHESQRDKIWNLLNGANWPKYVQTNVRDYSQGENTRAVFELDFGFLEHVEEIDLVIINLSETVEIIKRALGEEFNVTVSPN